MAFMTGALAISELDDLRGLAGLAVARLAQSIGEGCARDACTWMRVYERLQRHVSRLESALPSEPAAPALAAERATEAVRPAPDAAATPAASDASDSLDRLFFDAVLSSWPSSAPAPHAGRRQTGMAP